MSSSCASSKLLRESSQDFELTSRIRVPSKLNKLNYSPPVQNSTFPLSKIYDDLYSYFFFILFRNFRAALGSIRQIGHSAGDPTLSSDSPEDFVRCDFVGSSRCCLLCVLTENNLMNAADGRIEWPLESESVWRKRSSRPPRASRADHPGSRPQAAGTS